MTMSAPHRAFRGNAHHLSRLEEAVRAGDAAIWNTFVRRSGPGFRARLAGADLSGWDMGEFRLDGADLCDASLAGAVLVRANLSGARLRNADLSGADLTGARLNRADLSRADLKKARMNQVKARGAVLIDADLSEARMDDADLTSATLKGAALTGSSPSAIRKKVRVKVRSEGRPRGDGEATRPWIRARDEEERLRDWRRQREEEEARSERDRLDRKLGRKKPLFKRIK